MAGGLRPTTWSAKRGATRASAQRTLPLGDLRDRLFLGALCFLTANVAIPSILTRDLVDAQLRTKMQLAIPLLYKDVKVECVYRADRESFPG